MCIYVPFFTSRFSKLYIYTYHIYVPVDGRWYRVPLNLYIYWWIMSYQFIALNWGYTHEKKTHPNYAKCPSMSAWWRITKCCEKNCANYRCGRGHGQIVTISRRDRALESWLIREIIPKWPWFRLVNYYNLPRIFQIDTTSCLVYSVLVWLILTLSISIWIPAIRFWD